MGCSSSDAEINEYKEKLRCAFVEEITNVQRIGRENSKRLGEIETALENKKQRLDSWSLEINKREEYIERERQKLVEEKMKMKAEENVMRLIEEQKREKKTALEKVEELNEELQDEREENDNLLTLCQQLVTKERQSNDELQEARKVLIAGWDNLRSRSHVDNGIKGSGKINKESKESYVESFNESYDGVSIKKIGEIDVEAFENACFCRSITSESIEIRAAETCSFWQEQLKNPEWYPFKIIEYKNGNAQECLDRTKVYADSMKTEVDRLQKEKEESDRSLAGLEAQRSSEAKERARLELALAAKCSEVASLESEIEKLFADHRSALAASDKARLEAVHARQVAEEASEEIKRKCSEIEGSAEKTRLDFEGVLFRKEAELTGMAATKDGLDHELVQLKESIPALSQEAVSEFRREEVDRLIYSEILYGQSSVLVRLEGGENFRVVREELKRFAADHDLYHRFFNLTPPPSDSDDSCDEEDS